MHVPTLNRVLWTDHRSLARREGREQGRGGEEDLGTERQNRLRNYRKLFHLLIGNCFITCRLLIETAVGRAPKFVFSVTTAQSW